MSRWSDFADSYELIYKLPLDNAQQLYSIRLTRANVLYIKSLTTVDSRTLKWHLNKALEMYIHSLENDIESK